MKFKNYLIITFFTLISPFIHGYYFAVLDHHHYLPYLNKLLNPALYPNDYYFTQPHFLYSSFNYFLVEIKKVTGLSHAWIHLGVFLVTLWLLYYAVFSLADTLYKNRSISFLAVALFLLPKWVGGGYLTHSFYFTSRDLSTALSLLALNLIINQKLWPAFWLLLLTVLVNPLVPIPIAVFWLFIKLKPFRLRLKQTLVSIIPVDVTWLKILQSRGTYSFPHLWNWTGWGNLTLITSVLITAWLGLQQKIFGKFYKPLKIFLTVCSGLFLLHFFFSALLPTMPRSEKFLKPGK